MLIQDRFILLTCSAFFRTLIVLWALFLPQNTLASTYIWLGSDSEWSSGPWYLVPNFGAIPVSKSDTLNWNGDLASIGWGGSTPSNCVYVTTSCMTFDSMARDANITSGSTVNFNSGSTFRIEYGSSLDIINSGTLNINDALLEVGYNSNPGHIFLKSTSNININGLSRVDITSGSTLNVQAGVFTLSSTESNNNFNAMGGGSVNITGGAFRFAGSETLDDAGNFNLNGGTLLVDSGQGVTFGYISPSYPGTKFNFYSGTINPAVESYQGNILITGDTLNFLGSGIKRLERGQIQITGIDSRMNLMEGNFINSSRISINGGTINQEAPSIFTLGSVFIPGSGFQFGEMDLLSGVTYNFKGGDILIQGSSSYRMFDGSFNWSNGGSINTLSSTSYGVFELKGGAMNLSDSTNKKFGNGTLRLTGGSLNVNDGVLVIGDEASGAAILEYNAGSLFVGATEVLELNGSGSSIQVKGNLSLSGTGILRLKNGTLTIDPGKQLTTPTNFTLQVFPEETPTINNQGTLVMNGILNIASPIAIGGEIIFKPGSVLSSSYFAVDQPLTTTGSVTWEGGTFVEGKVINQGITNVTGTSTWNGTFENQNGAFLNVTAGLMGTHTINNAGTINLDTGGGVVIDSTKTLSTSGIFNYINGTLTNNGVINNSGSFNVVGTSLEITGGGSFVNDGTLSGNVKIIGQVTNNGVISPGNSPGYVEASGSYLENGTLEIELGGANGPLTPGGVSDYDYFYASAGSGSGDVTISDGSILKLSLINGFIPTAGMTFDFLIADGLINGNVNGYYALDFSLATVSGIDWVVIYNTTSGSLSFGNKSLRLIAQASATVPEPSTYLILGTLLMLVVMIRRENQSVRAKP